MSAVLVQVTRELVGYSSASRVEIPVQGDCVVIKHLRNEIRVNVWTRAQFSYLVQGKDVEYITVVLPQESFRKMTNDIVNLNHKHLLRKSVSTQESASEPELLVGLL